MTRMLFAIVNAYDGYIKSNSSHSTATIIHDPTVFKLTDK